MHFQFCSAFADETYISLSVRFALDHLVMKLLLLPSQHVVTLYINLISTDQKLVSPIFFQCLLVFFNYLMHTLCNVKTMALISFFFNICGSEHHAL